MFIKGTRSSVHFQNQIWWYWDSELPTFFTSCTTPVQNLLWSIVLSRHPSYAGFFGYGGSKPGIDFTIRSGHYRINLSYEDANFENESRICTINIKVKLKLVVYNLKMYQIKLICVSTVWAIILKSVLTSVNFLTLASFFFMAQVSKLFSVFSMMMDISQVCDCFLLEKGSNIPNITARFGCTNLLQTSKELETFTWTRTCEYDLMSTR